MKYLIIVVCMLVLYGCTAKQNVQNETDEMLTKSPTTNVPEVTVKQDGEELVARPREGIFTKVNQRYTVRGSVTMDGRVLRFSEDFEVSAGPDLFVHLGKEGKYSSAARVAGLKNIRGAQEYLIPDEIDTTDFDEVWVWCRAFSVGFAMAELK